MSDEQIIARLVHVSRKRFETIKQSSGGKYIVYSYELKDNEMLVFDDDGKMILEDLSVEFFHPFVLLDKNRIEIYSKVNAYPFEYVLTFIKRLRDNLTFDRAVEEYVLPFLDISRAYLNNDLSSDARISLINNGYRFSKELISSKHYTEEDFQNEVRRIMAKSSL